MHNLICSLHFSKEIFFSCHQWNRQCVQAGCSSVLHSKPSSYSVPCQSLITAHPLSIFTLLPLVFIDLYSTYHPVLVTCGYLSFQVPPALLWTVRWPQWQRPLPQCPGDLGWTTTAQSSATPSRPEHPSFSAGKLLPLVGWCHLTVCM